MNNKIMKEVRFRALLPVLLLIAGYSVQAQKLQQKLDRLPYINNDSAYRKSIAGHPEKQMMPLSIGSGFMMDLRYASENNFMRKKLYPENTQISFLRRRVWLALDSVRRDLALQGKLPVIWDAYRPYRVTIELWEKVKDERYAANPLKGSGHNRGIAVDLTLAEANTHQLLPMPTDFDNFTDSAHQDFNSGDAARSANRALLKQVMVKYGFLSLETEWWHFSWPNPERFEILDLSFQELEKVEP